MDLKDFYAKSLLLPDNDLLIVKYEISKRNIGKVQLSNSVKLLDNRTTKELKQMLRFIEPFATEYYFVPCHDTT